jgi:putative phage-type endonuclease
MSKRNLSNFIHGKLLLDGIDIPERRHDWLKIKESSVGSSEISTILGDNKFENNIELWNKKKGRGEQFTGNDATRAGNAFEAGVLDLFSQKTGLKVKQPHAIYAHPEFSFLTASPDSFIYDPSQEVPFGIGEAKFITSHYSAEQWTDEPPVNYYNQVQWQLGVLGLQWGYLIGFVCGSLMEYRIEFDADWFASAMEKAQSFISSLTFDAPPYEILKDGLIIKAEQATATIPVEWKEQLAKFVEIKDKKAVLEKQLRVLDKELEPIKNELIVHFTEANATQGVVQDESYHVKVTQTSIPASQRKAYSYYNVTIKERK